MNASNVPFLEIAALDQSNLVQVTPSNNNPQPQDARARGTKRSLNYLPGCPHIPLSSTKVSELMQRELSTPVLDDLYPRLWMVARKAHDHIDPLHRQIIKGRKILLTEDIQLHLLWQVDKIYIKPVPPWLLNYQVWSRYLPHAIQEASRPTTIHPEKQAAIHGTTTLARSNTRGAALGFLRSYAHLIQHESDFIIAHQHHLIPSNVSWVAWSQFIVDFRDIADHEVCSRYQYGQMRLTRLHWAVRLFRPRSASTKWFYHLPYWSVTPYLHSILTPLAFAFATLSLVLSAMQVLVTMSAEDLGYSNVNESGLEKMRWAFWGFSISLVLASGILWILFLFVPFCVLVWQLQWGFRHRKKSNSCLSVTNGGA